MDGVVTGIRRNAFSIEEVLALSLPQDIVGSLPTGDEISGFFEGRNFDSCVDINGSEGRISIARKGYPTAPIGIRFLNASQTAIVTAIDHPNMRFHAADTDMAVVVMQAIQQSINDDREAGVAPHFGKFDCQDFTCGVVTRMAAKDKERLSSDLVERTAAVAEKLPHRRAGEFGNGQIGHVASHAVMPFGRR